MKKTQNTVVGLIAAALIIFGVQLIRQGNTAAVSDSEWKNIKDTTKAHTARRRRGVAGMTAGGIDVNVATAGGGGYSI